MLKTKLIKLKTGNQQRKPMRPKVTSLKISKID